MDEFTYKDFMRQLHDCTKFTCIASAVLNGEGVYHVLAIHDVSQVAVKFYERSRRKWIYFFEDGDRLWRYYQNGWIELRNG